MLLARPSAFSWVLHKVLKAKIILLLLQFLTLNKMIKEEDNRMRIYPSHRLLAYSAVLEDSLLILRPPSHSRTIFAGSYSERCTT